MPADAPASAVPALELRHIDKRFGTVQANRDVSLVVAAGSIHGLIGENGAGKSTLMNIAYGVHEPDTGEIWVAGQRRVLGSPAAAIAAGIAMVHQHFMLVPNFTVLENVILGVEGGLTLRARLREARERLAALGRDYELDVPLDALVGELPVGGQQRVEILKALYRRAQILILDEPTAVLTPQETQRLFRMLRRLRDEGKSIVLVTHKLPEIMAVTDRVTVMRQGAVVDEVPTAQTAPRQLAERMVGRPVSMRIEKTPAIPGEPLLEVRQLGIRDDRGIERVRDVSFTVRAGEIVGLAGVAGNGQTELLEAIAGMAPIDRGEIRLCGHDVVREGLDGAKRRALGLAHVPEDRLRTGVVSSFSAEDNLLLGYQDRAPFSRHGILQRTAIREVAAARLREHDVRPAAPTMPIVAFSGGNQQKIVLAREMDMNPRVLLVGQPTRGVDIGAIEAIHRRLVALRDAGKALLVVSVELDEILGLSDRILVMHDGKIAGELRAEEATEERIGRLMAGVADKTHG